ncbi:hypothetical protein [Chlorogloeopsis sp. ULAP02]|uniref:hypothetical protein n=1 Tax=Chlorogloeopsis sp. ULAP02 TaxID=3107926 RepID=UPI0031360681
MTSFESNGICIEVVNPNTLLFPTRIYPIPKNQNGVDVPIKLCVSINHNNSNYFYLNPLQAFIPELLTSDGQIIQGDLVIEEGITNNQLNRLMESNHTRQFEWFTIRSKCRTTFSLTARLFWQDNSLQLKIPTIPDYVIGSITPNYFWYFKVLQPETYQLRLILNTDNKTTYVSRFNNSQERTVRETNSQILVTPWLNIRLVQPLSTDIYAIEIDGVLFKTDMPESVLAIPPMQSGAKTDINLGIRVTNNTSTAFRFYQAHSINVTLIDIDGKEINWFSEMVRPGLGKRTQYYLVQPRESTFFDLEAMIFWRNGQLELAITNQARGLRDCGFYYFPGLKCDTLYRLQLIYHISERSAKCPQEKVSETVWNGWLAMPFVEFRLVNPSSKSESLSR